MQNMADIQFQDVSNQRKSDVWSHFLCNKGKAQQTPPSPSCAPLY